MIIHQIHDLSNSNIVSLLEQGMSQVTEPELIKNYHPDFKSDNSNLFYILKNGRYKIGNYYVAEEDGNYIGSAGWNWYKDDIALALTRAYIAPNHRQRNIMATYFLPSILDETALYNKIWCTCNEYNKVIYNGFVRIAMGKRAGLTNPWLDIYSKFVPIGIQTVNYTEQYVAEYKRNL
jgi:hypothetical protein